MGSVSRRRSLVSEASNASVASVTCQSSQVAQTVFPVRPRLLFNDGELLATGRFEKCRMVPCVAIYTNSRGNTIPRSSNKGSGRNGDQPLVRNGDETTSPFIHLSFRLSLVGLHSQSPRNSLLFLWLCSIKSTKSNPNLSALTGKSFRPRS